MKEKAPYVSSHAVERYKELVGRDVSHGAAVKTLHWAWHTGQRIKKEKNGTIHIMCTFKKELKKGGEEVDGVLIVSKQNNDYNRRAMLTVLSMDHYMVNGSLTVQQQCASIPKKKRRT